MCTERKSKKEAHCIGMNAWLFYVKEIRCQFYKKDLVAIQRVGEMVRETQEDK